MEKTLLEIISEYIKDKNVIVNSQLGFSNGKSCLTGLNNKTMSLVNEGRVPDINCEFNKAFHSLL